MKAFKIAAIAAGILLASSVGSASVGVHGPSSLPCGQSASVDRNASTNPKVAHSSSNATAIRGVRAASAQ